MSRELCYSLGSSWRSLKVGCWWRTVTWRKKKSLLQGWWLQQCTEHSYSIKSGQINKYVFKERPNEAIHFVFPSEEEVTPQGSLEFHWQHFRRTQLAVRRLSAKWSTSGVARSSFSGNTANLWVAMCEARHLSLCRPWHLGCSRHVIQL